MRTPWEELGIAPTEDHGAIRRAYAARLKALDVDRDPAGFMRLRQAYEDALADTFDAELSSMDDLIEDDDTGPDEQNGADNGSTAVINRASLVTADAAPGVPYGAFDEFRTAYSRAMTSGETRAAAATLRTALAEGIVPIGSEAALVGELVDCALDDKSLSPEELDEIGRTFGASGTASATDPLSALPRDVRERAAAIRWYAQIQADARRGDGRVLGYLRQYGKRTRIARVIRDAPDQNILSRDLPTLREEVAKAQRYARWLDGAIDAGALSQKLAKLEGEILGHEVIAIVLGIVIIAGITIQWWQIGVAIGTLFAAAIAWAYVLR